MKKIILLLVVALLLGGGGFGAYIYFMKPAEAATTDGDHADAAKASDHAEKSEKKSSGGHGGDHGGYKFVELDPLILPIIDNNGVSQTVSIVVALEVADDATAAKVEGLAPRLKDAYIQEMYGVLNKQAALRGGVIQVSYLKKRLNTISHHVLGEGVINDVLLQVVQQRPV